MSYCRWSCPVPELTPAVDISAVKMHEIYVKGGGYSDWLQYLNDNNVVLSDAYVYETESEFVCWWKDEDDPEWADTAQEMAQILIDAVNNRNKHVPQSAIQMLLEEVDDKTE